MVTVEEVMAVIVTVLVWAVVAGTFSNGTNGMSARRKNNARGTLGFNPLATVLGSLPRDY